jgi:predicted DNA-binding protein (UPF0251 family)
MPSERNSSVALDAEEVRAVRTMLGLSASDAAAIVGLSDGAAWRKLERNGARGAAAKLLIAVRDSQAVRRYFGVSITADSTR